MSRSTRTRVTCDYPECPAVIEWVVESALGIQPSRHGWRHAGTYDDLCPMHAREVVGLAANNKLSAEVEA